MRWPVLLTLAFTALAATTNVQVYSLLVPSIASDLDRSVAFVGGMRTVASATSIVLALPFGRVADRIPRKRILIAGYLLMLVAGMLAVSISNIWWLIAYSIVAGAAEIILLPTVQAATADYASGPALGRATGVVVGSFGLSGIVLVPLAGVITSASSWRLAMFVVVAIGVVGLLLVARFLPLVFAEEGDLAAPSLQLRSLMSHPGLLPMLGSNLMRFAINFGVLTFVAAFLVTQHDVDESLTGLLIGVGSLVFLIVAVCSGFVIERIGRRLLLTTGSLTLIVGVALAYRPSISLALAGLLFLLAMGSLSLLENGALGFLLDRAGSARGAVMSINEMGAAIGGLAGSGLGGIALSVSGYSGLGWLLAALAVLALALIVTALRHTSTAAGR